MGVAPEVVMWRRTVMSAARYGEGADIWEARIIDARGQGVCGEKEVEGMSCVCAEKPC